MKLSELENIIWREIELLSITEMKRGAGTHYPYVTDGKGKGIIEDTSPYELAEMVEKTDKDGTLPQIMDMYSGKEGSWNYRKFDLEYCNVFFKIIYGKYKMHMRSMNKKVM